MIIAVISKITAMIILHFDLPPQFTYELFHIYFTPYHSSRENGLYRLTSLPMCGSVGRASHRYFAEVMGSNPVEALIFFRLRPNYAGALFLRLRLLTTLFRHEDTLKSFCVDFFVQNVN